MLVQARLNEAKIERLKEQLIKECEFLHVSTTYAQQIFCDFACTVIKLDFDNKDDQYKIMLEALSAIAHNFVKRLNLENYVDKIEINLKNKEWKK